MTRDPHRAFDLRVSLEYIEPAIWRAIRVPADLTLPQLHKVLQVVMGWSNAHLHQYHVQGRIYGTPDGEFDTSLLSEVGVYLNDVLQRPGDRLIYEYDFGDEWLHEVRLERVFENASSPRLALCLDGSGKCPPEDSGGPPGFQEFLAALSNRRHPEHRTMREWYGGTFDRDDFSVGEVNEQLRKLRFPKKGSRA